MICIRLKLLLSALLLVIVPCQYGQSQKARAVSKEQQETAEAKETLALQRLNLVTDLKALEAEVAKIDPPFARAVAKAGIADAAWKLDPDWSKKLIREAY